MKSLLKVHYIGLKLSRKFAEIKLNDWDKIDEREKKLLTHKNAEEKNGFKCLSNVGRVFSGRVGT